MTSCVVLLTNNLELNDWALYRHFFLSTGVKYEAVLVLLSLAFCILVTAFLFLCSLSFLPVRKPTCVDIFLNTATVIGGFIGGKDYRLPKSVLILIETGMMTLKQ